ncbi:MAG: hypothetical protein RLZZ244_3040, partial [Verrucomicrobiota bacterium]
GWMAGGVRGQVGNEEEGGVRGPEWWARRGVQRVPLFPNDYAMVNQGQLKAMAFGAAEELESTLPEGAGGEIRNLVEAWHSEEASNDFAPMNLGQLKRVALPFHERLRSAGYPWMVWEYPWKRSGASDFAPANLGQLKAMFAFDTTADANGNGLPDWWEFARLSPWVPDAATRSNYERLLGWTELNEDVDGDGISNVDEFRLGSNPFDFFNGIQPELSVQSGDGQMEPLNVAQGKPVEIRMTRPDGSAWPGAPLEVQVLSGDISLLEESQFGNWSGTIRDARTDGSGVLRLWTRLGPRAGVIRVRAARGLDLDDGASVELAERLPPAPPVAVAVRYHGRPLFLKRSGAGASEWNTDGTESQLLEVRVMDSEGKVPVGGASVTWEWLTGDAIFEDGVRRQITQSDAQGMASISAQRGLRFSLARAVLGSQELVFGVDQRRAGANEILSSSPQPGDRRHPALGVPVLHLSRPLPEDVDLNAPLPKSSPSYGGTSTRRFGLFAEVRRAIRGENGEAQSEPVEIAVPGVWRVLPGRKSVAFFPTGSLASYATEFQQVQKTLWFHLRIEGEALPWIPPAPVDLGFGLGTSVPLSSFDGPTALADLLRALESPDFLTPVSAPSVLDVFPLEGAVDVDVGFHPVVRFSQTLDPESVSAETVWLEREGGGRVGIRLECDSEANLLTILPFSPLEPGGRYRVTLSSGIRNLSGVGLEQAFSWSFQAARRVSALPQPPGDLERGFSRFPMDAFPLDGIFHIPLRPPDPALTVRSLSARLVVADAPETVVEAAAEYDAVQGVLRVVPLFPLQPGTEHWLEVHWEWGQELAPAAAARDFQSVAGSGGTVSGGSLRMGVLSASAKNPPPPPLLPWQRVTPLDLTGAGRRPETDSGGLAPGTYVTDPEAGTFQLKFVSWFRSSNQDATDHRFETAYRGGENVTLDLLGMESPPPPQKFSVLGPNGPCEKNESQTGPIPFGTAFRWGTENMGFYTSGSGTARKFVELLQAPEVALKRDFYLFAKASAPLEVVSTYLLFASYRMAEEPDQLTLYGVRTLPEIGPAVFSGGAPSPTQGDVGLPQWIRWCPVVVRDEEGARGPNGTELILPTPPPPWPALGGDPDQRALNRYFLRPFPKRGVAFIKAGLPAPEMPCLTVQVPNAPTGFRCRWRLRVHYDRKNGQSERATGVLGPRTQPEDIVDIPGRPDPLRFPPESGGPPSNVPGRTPWMEISEPWRIFETIEWRREVQSRGLFGGEALLYCVLEGVDAEFLVAHFRIGGENPTNELARSVVEQFIPGADPAGDL